MNKFLVNFSNPICEFSSFLWHWNGLLCADVPLRNCSLTPVFCEIGQNPTRKHPICLKKWGVTLQMTHKTRAVTTVYTNLVNQLPFSLPVCNTLSLYANPFPKVWSRQSSSEMWMWVKTRTVSQWITRSTVIRKQNIVSRRSVCCLMPSLTHH